MLEARKLIKWHNFEGEEMVELMTEDVELQAQVYDTLTAMLEGPNRDVQQVMEETCTELHTMMGEQLRWVSSRTYCSTTLLKTHQRMAFDGHAAEQRLRV